jgi:hypothetical protein
MITKTTLRFLMLFVVTTASMFYLARAGEASANKIRLQEEATGHAILSQTSNTEYIFFESLSKFLVSSMH